MKDLDARLASEAFYSGDPELVRQALKRRGELEHALQTLESQWFDLHSQLDAIA
jgi:phage shock protein A